MGQKQAAYNLSGVVIAFYDTVDSPAPNGVNTIDITNAQWQAALATSGYTVVSGVLTAPASPTTAQLLAQAQATQIAALNAAYASAILAPVSYTTAGGTTATFAQDQASKANLTDALLGSEKAASWPLNLWLNAAGSPVTPFTYADLQGLSAAMEAYDTPKFTELLTLVGQVNAATTVAAVLAVVWS